mmetsp:Transcript_8912/g.36814  ORF Transcript_8912/g.36814 Transcript_8912/m.36814 type:complete len:187 (+) Transcript_8912:36-596(+)
MGDDLETVLAEREIQRCLVRYCRGVDRLDEQLVASCYHKDSYDEHGSFKGTGEEFAKVAVQGLKKRAVATQHSISNVSIELAGDVAQCESYVLVRHYVVKDGKPLLETAGARFVDRMERRTVRDEWAESGDEEVGREEREERKEWRIAKRIAVVDWGKTEQVAMDFPMPAFRQGMRSPDDVSYSRL